MNAREFTDGVNKFSKGKLNNREDLERVIDLAFRFDNKSELEELAFHAKYLNGLLRIIRSKENTLDDKYFQNVKNEYGDHIEKVKEKFLLIIEPGSEFIKEIFKKKYFELTVESFEFLNSFCDDLSKVKSYLNELKEGGKGF